MPSIFIVGFSDCGHRGITKVFTSKSEAEKYKDALDSEIEEDAFEWMKFYVEEHELYNEIEDING